MSSLLNGTLSAETIFTVIWVVVALIVLLVIIRNSIVVVNGRQIAIIERRWFGKKMPSGQVVARNSEVGVRAKTLGPGMHFLIPFLYVTNKSGFVEIAEDEVGLVEAIDGESLPPDRIFAKVISGHNSFQDAEAFLNNGGQKGPQIEYLTPGQYRINPVLFRVNKINSLHIPKGKIGIVTAMDGLPIDSGRLLAKSVDGHKSFQDGETFLAAGGQKGPQINIMFPGTYRVNTSLFVVAVADALIVPSEKVGLVTALDGKELPPNEYVAASVCEHDNFQNASAFLSAGGQRGPQLEVLRPGTYYINPYMFSVQLHNVAKVERGEVAVIVSNVGREPDQTEMGTEAGKPEVQLLPGIERYVVPQGYRGIQREVVGPGIYYLNPLAFIPYVVNTTNITIDWNDNDKDTKFNSLQVTSKDGFLIMVSVKVIIRVRPDQAPYMVAKIGSVENLIDHVIHPMIDSSFRNQASSTKAMSFLQDRQEEQKKAELHARQELTDYHVECVSVLICQIQLPQELMETQTMRIIAEQRKEMYKEQQLAEQTRIATEKSRAEADQQKNLMQAEIGVKIAEQEKLSSIKKAEGAKESRKLTAEGEAAGIKAIGDAEAQKILAIGNSTAEAYRKQCEAISPENVTVIEVFKRISESNIKIVPDILVQGQEGGMGMLTAYISTLMDKKSGAKEIAAPVVDENK